MESTAVMLGKLGFFTAAEHQLTIQGGQCKLAANDEETVTKAVVREWEQGQFDYFAPQQLDVISQTINAMCTAFTTKQGMVQPHNFPRIDAFGKLGVEIESVCSAYHGIVVAVKFALTTADTKMLKWANDELAALEPHVNRTAIKIANI